MRRKIETLLLAALLDGCGWPGSGAAPLASARFAGAAPLAVNCPAFPGGGVIPPRFSAKGANVSPPVTWASTAGAQSYALVVQDPDAPGPAPFVHWLIWNLPGSLTGLSAGVPSSDRPARPDGALQGRNGADGEGYHGPSPPPGAPHRYVFQVFALSSDPTIPPGAEIETVLAGLHGRVIAKGQCVGTFQSRLFS